MCLELRSKQNSQPVLDPKPETLNGIYPIAAVSIHPGFGAPTFLLRAVTLTERISRPP